jgi:hypothetical protein
MKNQTILFTILVFAIFQCSSYNQQTDKCEVYNAKSARCEVKYDLTNDIAYIDSALYYINEIFDECEQYQTLLGLRKVSLYSIKNEYLNSIKYLDTLIAKEIITQFYKNVLTNRFNAMQAQYNGDTINKRKYIQQAFNEVEQFYILNKSKIDSFLNIPYITAY